MLWTTLQYLHANGEVSAGFDQDFQHLRLVRVGRQNSRSQSLLSNIWGQVLVSIIRHLDTPTWSYTNDLSVAGATTSIIFVMTKVLLQQTHVSS